MGAWIMAGVTFREAARKKVLRMVPPCRVRLAGGDIGPATLLR